MPTSRPQSRFRLEKSTHIHRRFMAALTSFFLFADPISRRVENRDRHCHETPSKVFEHDLLSGERAGVRHGPFQIHTPHDMVRTTRIAIDDIIRVAARRVVLIWRTAMLDQFAHIALALLPLGLGNASSRFGGGSSPGQLRRRWRSLGRRTSVWPLMSIAPRWWRRL